MEVLLLMVKVYMYVYVHTSYVHRYIHTYTINLPPVRPSAYANSDNTFTRKRRDNPEDIVHALSADADSFNVAKRPSACYFTLV